MTTSDQESSMVVLEDVVKGRLLTRVVRSGAVVNKSSSKSSPSKSKKKGFLNYKERSLNLLCYDQLLLSLFSTLVLIQYTNLNCRFEEERKR